MRVEEEYNMLNQRIHFSDPITASAECIGIVDFDANSHGLLHRYSCWAFTFISGSDGIFYFGDNRYVVKAGTGILIPPFAPHYLVNENDEPLRSFYVIFDGNFFPHMQQAGFDAVLAANEKLQSSFYKKSLYETMSRIATQVDISDSSTLNEYRPLIMTNVIGFFVDCFCSDAASYRNASDMKLLKDVKQMIITNIDRNVTVEEMSKALFLSQRQFASRFTKLTGMSFKEYENMIKMEEASQMLYTTDKSISQISDELGFCDIHYFSRKFKEYYGCAPTTLRKKKV